MARIAVAAHDLPAGAGRRRVLLLLALALGAACALACAVGAAASQAAPSAPTRVCRTRALRSPFDYDGAAGPYASGAPGLPTYGAAGTDFPLARSGVVLPAGKADYLSYQLAPDTVYYLLPGVHTGLFQADPGDAFVGGEAGRHASVLNGKYAGYTVAIDSNWSNGNTPGVTVEYLTIERYNPPENAAAINQETNTGWTLRYDTVRRNVPGAGVFLGSEGTLEGNCLAENGQYGFQSAATAPWGHDSLTTGPYDLTVSGNEIANNDTCDFEGLLSNEAIGWEELDPVPAHFRNKHCPAVFPDGDQGGFKLWQTDGATIKGNYIHDNWGPGAWADTDNANTTIADNYFSGNDGAAVMEEISYNFAITDNTMVGNDIVGGLGNPWFPQPAVYVSESGSDTTFGGVPACAESACAGQGAYPQSSTISGNVMTNNGGNVFLWQSANRYCSDGFDDGCTLVDGGESGGPFTGANCSANLASAAIDTSTFAGELTGTPAEDWWDGCLWKTENVHVSRNTVNFDPEAVKDCNASAWPDCGAGGVFSQYGSIAPYDQPGSWVVPSSIAFHQGNVWSQNTYNGPSPFYAWNQGNAVSWEAWSGAKEGGDECSSENEHQAGECIGPFGQDAGSSYAATPVKAAVRKWRRSARARIARARR